MIKRLFKFTLFFTALLILVLTVAPLIFFDKKDVAKIINQKINEEFSLNLKFNEDLDIKFFPFPKINVSDVIFLDKSLGIEVRSESVELSSSWKSLIKLVPELKAIEINKPEILISKKESSSKFTLINYQNKRIEVNKFRILLKKLQNLKITNGRLIFFISGDQHELKDLNFFLSTQNRFNAQVEFNYLKFNSLVKIDANSKALEKIEYNISQLFSNSNEIFGSGVVNIKNDNIFLNGNFNSNKIHIKQIFDLIAQLDVFYKKQKAHFVSSKIPSVNFDFSFQLTNVFFKKLKFENVSTNIFTKNDNIFIKDLRLKYLKSIMKMNGIYSFSNKNLDGDLVIYDFFYESPKLESSKIYLTDANFDCDVTFSITNLSDAKNFLSAIKARGECVNQKSRLVGIDISDLVKRADNIETFQDFFSLFNKKKIKGSSNVDSISLNFRLNKGKLFLDNFQAEQENMRVRSKGNYSLFNQNFKIDSLVYVRTQKFKNLPEFNISMIGKPKDYKVSYNFDKVKDAIFSDGINSILKKTKKLTLDPNSLQEIIKKKSKEIEPEDILKLFLD